MTVSFCTFLEKQQSRKDIELPRLLHMKLFIIILETLLHANGIKNAYLIHF